MSPEPPKTANRVLQLGLAALGGGGLVALGVIVSTATRPAPAAPTVVVPPATQAAPVRFEPALGVVSARALSSSPDRNGAREYALKLTLEVANLPNPPADVIVKVGGEEASVVRQPADLGYDMTLAVNASGLEIQSRLSALEKAATAAQVSLELFDRRNPSHAFVTSTYMLKHDLLSGNLFKEVPPAKNVATGTKPVSTNTVPPPSASLVPPINQPPANNSQPQANNAMAGNSVPLPGRNNSSWDSPPPTPAPPPARIADASGKTTIPGGIAGGKAEVRDALSTLTPKDRQQIVKLASDAIHGADRCLDNRYVFSKCKSDLSGPPQKLADFLNSRNITIFKRLEQRLHPDSFDGVRLLKAELNAIATDVTEVDR